MKMSSTKFNYPQCGGAEWVNLSPVQWFKDISLDKSADCDGSPPLPQSSPIRWWLPADRHLLGAGRQERVNSHGPGGGALRTKASNSSPCFSRTDGKNNYRCPQMSCASCNGMTRAHGGT